MSGNDFEIGLIERHGQTWISRDDLLAFLKLKYFDKRGEKIDLNKLITLIEVNFDTNDYMMIRELKK